MDVPLLATIECQALKALTGRASDLLAEAVEQEGLKCKVGRRSGSGYDDQYQCDDEEDEAAR